MGGEGGGRSRVGKGEVGGVEDGLRRSDGVGWYLEQKEIVV